jgi:hypothetical protein
VSAGTGAVFTVTLPRPPAVDRAPGAAVRVSGA